MISIAVRWAQKLSIFSTWPRVLLMRRSSDSGPGGGAGGSVLIDPAEVPGNNTAAGACAKMFCTLIERTNSATARAALNLYHISRLLLLTVRQDFQDHSMPLLNRPPESIDA